MKTSFKLVFSLVFFLVMSNTTVFSQVHHTVTPVFEIIKMQDGTENGDDVVYMVKITDGSGRPLVNTSNEDFIIAIEFGVDSDAEASDLETAFPTSVAIQQGTGSTVIKLKVFNDKNIETPESLVAMIYNPSLGKISETLSYAQATISDNDEVSLVSTAEVVSNTTAVTKVANNDTNPIITMLQK